MPTSDTFTDELKQEAQRLGFTLSGVTAAASPGRLQQFHSWLEAGYAAGMAYLERRRKAYEHPKHVLEGCRSILMLGLPYASTPPAETLRSEGKLARYARSGTDYHDVVHQRLQRLKGWVQERFPSAQVRGVVDTAPLLEREFAEAAGLGWVGKNTLLLNREQGSYFFLAALLTDLELRLDPPQAKGYCGTCTACLDGCPTQAFPAPYVLDANRCISYLTIEHRGEVAEDVQNRFAGWLFGCDVCQEVCPWNRYEKSTDADFEESQVALPLLEMLELDEAQFRARFRKTAMWRTRREGLLRNAILLCVAQQWTTALPHLRRLAEDDSGLVRDMAAWGIAQLQPPESSS